MPLLVSPTIFSRVALSLSGQTVAQLQANLIDVHNQRLTWMDETGVDYMVLSCASPCLQGLSDPVLAESLMPQINDDTAATISNNTMRFGAFAALSMHNATAAAIELRRTVTQYGFLGALVNDYQQSGSDNGINDAPNSPSIYSKSSDRAT